MTDSTEAFYRKIEKLERDLAAEKAAKLTAQEMSARLDTALTHAQARAGEAEARMKRIEDLCGLWEKEVEASARREPPEVHTRALDYVVAQLRARLTGATIPNPEIK